MRRRYKAVLMQKNNDMLKLVERYYAGNKPSPEYWYDIMDEDE